MYTVKPRFTAPRLTANPDLPLVIPFPEPFFKINFFWKNIIFSDIFDPFSTVLHS